MITPSILKEFERTLNHRWCVKYRAPHTKKGYGEHRTKTFSEAAAWAKVTGLEIISIKKLKKLNIS